ncbi:hypothetical protein WDW37_14395 [Bdellovibrionota bacterium FG-1]
MRHPQKLLFRVVFIYGLSLFVHANAGSLTEIQVSLFGQPCFLQGPVDSKTLKNIHALSPEQLYPLRETPLSSAPTRKALEKLRSPAPPAGLERYRDRLLKRFEAQLGLLEGIEAFKKSKNPTVLLNVGKKYLSARKLKDFESLVKKTASPKELSQTIDLLFDSFSDGIEADPEEEFHRSIHRMKIQYICSFEGETSESEADE